ncbi:MAG TPA: nucleoside 2-deoxyribosyltransferase [Acetobacteraceae bacterium]|jgi:nucleoside 2-deoxyribosyltransferase|nr:nucleoside 2-deoxyribosyltransferase [Acetobacteraceae bacterium]
MTARVYLAGPDVFLPEAEAWAARRAAICARHGLTAVSPLDALGDESPWTNLPDWQQISFRNEAHIRGCQAIIANLTPFRGPSADVGTVYEMGYARALGLAVFGYSNCPVPFTQRSLDYVMTHSVAMGGSGRVWRDADGLLIEQFKRHDNLMIEGGIVGSGGVLVVPESEPSDRWRDLTTFEKCVAIAAKLTSPA